MKKLHIIALIFISGVILATPRGEAVGSFSSFISEDAISDGNPALASINKNHIFIISYKSPFAGLGEPVNLANVGYLHSLRSFSTGLSWGLTQSDIYSISNLGLVFSKNIGVLSLGARARMIFDSYDEGDFDFGPEDNIDDPIFDNGNSKLVFTGDVGLTIRLKSRFNFGLSMENLIDPDMALDGVFESKSGRELNSQLRFDMSKHGSIYGNLSYAFSAPEGSYFGYGLGYESMPIGELLNFRAGFNDRDLSLGAGFNFDWMIPLRFDYTFSYHHSELGKASTGHGFALVGYIEPLVVLPDLAVNISSDKEKYAIDDTMHIHLKAYTSALEAKAVSVELKIDGDVLKVFTVDKLSPELPQVFDFEYLCKKAGKLDLEAIIDSKNTIKESDEENNSAITSVEIFFPPTIEVSATPKTLRINQASYINQDESIVPVIFFTQGSSEIDIRFDSLLDILSERILLNPSAKFVINGYYDSLSEPDSREIAAKRARAVRSALLKRAAEAKARIIIGDEPPDKRRVARESQYTEYQRLVDEENRRVEIEIEMPDVRFESDVALFDSHQAKNIVADVLDELKSNPLSMLVIRVSEKGVLLEEAIYKSLQIKRILLGELPEFLKHRVLASSDETLSEGKVLAFLSGDAIAYKPREIHSALSYEPEEFADCQIVFSAHSEIDISEWELFFLDEKDNRLLTIASGEDRVNERISWDWRDSEGGLIPFGEKFAVCISAVDELGQTSEKCTRKELGTEVIYREERTDRLLLVQFIFDAPSPQSRYLKDRLEWVARYIVEKGSSDESSIYAELQGHTDIIGGHRRNLELSRDRAKSVEIRLMAYMTGILELTDGENLEQWMIEHDVNILSKGYAETEPYTLELWKEGFLVREQIGDDGLPEGRVINRRVVVTITETRENGGEDE
ncbi:type IX secretion system membrane protein PorP/SprF [bacterium]|nr:type IX secretion system membrane protein PorP/SprF [bacterium]